MAIVLTAAQYAVLQHAIQSYVLGTAPENQFHESAIHEISRVTVATGFHSDTHTAQQAFRDRPFTTLVGFAAFIGFPGGGILPGPPNRVYSTNFSTPENPLSEGGNWENGADTGLDWSNCEATVSGGVHYAAGLQDGPGQPNYSDAVGLLLGIWTPNQSVTAVFHSSGAPISGFKESEIRLRSSLSAHSSTGYEIVFSVSSSTPYIAVIRWNGALGDFTDITPAPTDLTHFLQNGDTAFASIIGNNIIVKLNGATIYNFTDNSFATGRPGMGFSVPNNATVDTSYGWSSLTATDGL